MLRSFQGVRRIGVAKTARLEHIDRIQVILTSRGRSLAVVMVADVIPGLNRFLRILGVTEASRVMISRLIAGFLLHRGRMSCLQTAGAIRSDVRHRAQVGRFLGRKRLRTDKLLDALRGEVLRMVRRTGLYVFVIDATLCSQQGTQTANTFQTGNRQRRPRKGRRHGQNKHARRSVHSFTMALLLTPDGQRLPFQKPYKTRETCAREQCRHFTSAESAAVLIRELQVPAGARVVVLGDTAYDSVDVQAACDERGFTWIVPCNSERVLSGPKPRPKVRSLIQELSSVSLTPIPLVAGQGPYARYERKSASRTGRKRRTRTFYVHEERRTVQSVGAVRLVFSTTQAQLRSATPDTVKILMTNDQTLPLKDVVALYTLRWQIEQFFKELKSTLGFHQYRFQNFEAVISWVDLALIAFLYLEWYRARQLTRRAPSKREQTWWRCQRTHGLCQAVRLASEQAELKYLVDRLKTPGGTQKLQRTLRNSFPKEYRATA